jgi:hypothetical protein
MQHLLLLLLQQLPARLPFPLLLFPTAAGTLKTIRLMASPGLARRRGRMTSFATVRGCSGSGRVRGFGSPLSACSCVGSPQEWRIGNALLLPVSLRSLPPLPPLSPSAPLICLAFCCSCRFRPCRREQQHDCDDFVEYDLERPPGAALQWRGAHDGACMCCGGGGRRGALP